MIPAITPLYAGVLGLIYLALSLRVPRLRLKYGVGIGDGGIEELARAVRVHGNFAEYVPFCLFLLLLIEGRGASPWFVHAMGMLLVAGRVLHAVGLNRTSGTSPARFIGMILTFSVLLLTSALCVLGVLVSLLA